MPATLQPASLQHDRRARRVHRTHLRLSSESARFTAVFFIEEALRLVTLPHEDEGRLYFFRTLALPALPEQANRRAWTEVLQASLTAAAAAAFPGPHPSAATASAVFFHNKDEAMESLLRTMLQDVRAPAPWFAPSLLGLAAHSPTSVRAGALLPAVMEYFRPPAMLISTGATALMSAISMNDPSSLLKVLPEEMLRNWFRAGRHPDKPVAVDSQKFVVNLTPALNETVKKVAAAFGWRSPATTWFTAMALAATSPSLPETLIQVCARGTLRELESTVVLLPTRLEPATPPQLFRIDTHSQNFDERTENYALAPANKLLVFRDDEPHSERFENATPAPASLISQSETQENQSNPAKTQTDAPPQPAKQTLLGEPTPNAGLYFLLHVLRHLGIGDALGETPDLAEADLPAHILHVLATGNGVLPTDPILIPLGIHTPFDISSKTLAQLPAGALPQTSSPSFTFSDSGAFLRHWVRAVRLWCAHNARITVRRILFRPGHIWLTRADLDVTLPISAADIRIRRIGLDLDPLWLPWLGPTGRVVRFHYTGATEHTGGPA